MEKVNLSSDKLKNAWEYYAKFGFEKDGDIGTYGFSWPQRNYRCSFCKKEFKSAQALGGHMNVHRRERAKMRLLPFGEYLNPNPNSNLFPPSSLSCAAKFLPASKSYQSSNQNDFLAPSLEIADRDHMGESLNKRAFRTEVEDLRFLTKGNDSILLKKKKKEIVRVGLNVSFLCDSRDDLDLELRLGHSHK